MFKKAIFILLTLQFITAFIHSLSFLVSPAASNETEQQLVDLFTTYKQDLGLGFHRSTYDLFRGLSACFTLICVLGGWINLYFFKNNLSLALWKGLLKIEIIVFGAVFTAMLIFTFLPPIVLTGLIFIAAIAARYAMDKTTVEA